MSIWAEPETPRRAVIIGINKYADGEIPELAGAENDAREMYEKLRDYGGFEIAKNHFLIGPDATYKAIRKAISDLLWETDKCYLSVLYFSGHGFQDGYENGYIAPYDMKASEPFVCGIDMEELKQVFLKTRNKDCALLILDCCYSGIPTQGKGSAAAAEIEAPFEKRFGAIREETKTGAGKIILASSGKDERSRETKDRKH
ncbi:MAG TPA: caspase family protein, partial [Syntrophorhabdales bacterium]|nr:caspase family protein [Syntrophorhabdales bacterium]